MPTPENLSLNPVATRSPYVRALSRLDAFISDQRGSMGLRSGLYGGRNSTAAPGILILDEPTGGLDGENMRSMAASMEHAAHNGACLLVITHDLELMNLVCTEKIVLNKQSREANLYENNRAAAFV